MMASQIYAVEIKRHMLERTSNTLGTTQALMSADTRFISKRSIQCGTTFSLQFNEKNVSYLMNEDEKHYTHRSKGPHEQRN